jgi:hypothetical protein
MAKGDSDGDNKKVEAGSTGKGERADLKGGIVFNFRCI